MTKTPTPAKRIRLTHEQKKLLLGYHHANSRMLQHDLCVWAAAAFALPRPPAPSTLRLLIKDPASDSFSKNSQPLMKTSRSAPCERPEAEIVRWIEACEKLCLPVVSGTAIRTKAAQIRDRLVREEPSAASINKLKSMVFSNGWLDKLKQRHGIKSRTLHGEASSVSAAAVAAGRDALREAMRGYSNCDIFNMDETAYFYCTAPTRTHAKSNFVGLKQVKKRITVVVTSNADGSAKIPLLFVGTAHQPRCFLGKSADELGIQYNNAAKGWMTTALFQRWLEQFNAAMRDENRNVLLLLDNAPCHRVSIELSNIRMLPPNTTAHLQPQDSGVIHAFKARIDTIKNRHVVEKLDILTQHAHAVGSAEGLANTLFDVDVLCVIRWAQEAWDSVTSATISNCWRHTAILDEESYELVQYEPASHSAAVNNKAKMSRSASALLPRWRGFGANLLTCFLPLLLLYLYI